MKTGYFRIPGAETRLRAVLKALHDASVSIHGRDSMAALYMCNANLTCARCDDSESEHGDMCRLTVIFISKT